MKELFALFLSIAPMSDELTGYLKDVLRPRTVTKKEIILREGDTARHIYFVQKGLIRSFYRLDDDEINNWFMKEGDIFISVQSFFFQQPSHETIEAMEDGIIWGISFEQLQHAYKNFPEFHVHRGGLLERYYAMSEERMFQTRKQPMIKRYSYLMDRYPELLRRVPAKHIATYLGMNEATLSIIRKQYAQLKIPANGNNKHS